MTETTDTSQSTRACVACGQKKPLVAFLELAGKNGRSYGDICAACRGAGLGPNATKESGDSSDKSGGSLRLRIDSKTLIQDALEKKEQFKHQTELDYEEKTKKETTEAEKSTASEERKEAEKKSREEYLDLKNQSFLSASKGDKQKTAFGKDKALMTQNFYQEQNKKDHFTHVEQDKQQANSEERKNTTTDLAVTFMDEHTSTIGRSAESVFGRFREFLGKGAAINRTLEQYKNKTSSHQPTLLGNNAKNEAQKTDQANLLANKAKNEAQKMDVELEADVDFVRNNLKPRPR